MTPFLNSLEKNNKNGFPNLQISLKNNFQQGSSYRDQILAGGQQLYKQKQIKKANRNCRISMSFNERNISPWNRKRGESIDKKTVNGWEQMFKKDSRMENKVQQNESRINIMTQQAKMDHFLEKIQSNKKNGIFKHIKHKSQSSELNMFNLKYANRSNEQVNKQKRNRHNFNISDIEIAQHLESKQHLVIYPSNVLNQEKVHLPCSKIHSKLNKFLVNNMIKDNTIPQNKQCQSNKLNKKGSSKVSDLKFRKTTNNSYSTEKTQMVQSFTKTKMRNFSQITDPPITLKKRNSLITPVNKSEFKQFAKQRGSNILSKNKTRNISQLQIYTQNMDDESQIQQFIPSYCTPSSKNSAVKNLKIRHKKSMRVKTCNNEETKKRQKITQKQELRNYKPQFLIQTFFKSKRWTNNFNITKTLKFHNKKTFKQNLDNILKGMS